MAEISQGSIVQFEGDSNFPPMVEGIIYAGTVVGRSDAHGPAWHINVVHPNIVDGTWVVPAEKVRLLTDWQHTSRDGTWMPPGDHDMRPTVGTQSKWINCEICGLQLRPPKLPAIQRPSVGDQVAIHAEVLEVIGGVGIRVRLYSKTDEYEAWVREDHLDPTWLERSRNEAFRSTIEEMVDSLTEKLEHLPPDTRVVAEVRSLIDTGKEILRR